MRQNQFAVTVLGKAARTGNRLIDYPDRIHCPDGDRAVSLKNNRIVEVRGAASLYSKPQCALRSGAGRGRAIAVEVKDSATPHVIIGHRRPSIICQLQLATV